MAALAAAIGAPPLSAGSTAAGSGFEGHSAQDLAAVAPAHRPPAVGPARRPAAANAATPRPVHPGTGVWPDSLPAGSTVLEFENLEGVILLHARLHGDGGRDTTALLALDTGAGWLALDHDLAIALGVADSSMDRDIIDFASRALPRLELGSLQIDHLAPVLTFDAGIVREVTDRPVEGLIGERALAGHALAIDYPDHVLALIPTPGPARTDAKAGSLVVRSRAALRHTIGPDAIPVRFDLAGDGKILVRARVSNPEPPERSPLLTLVLDTGATKCVLFEEAVEDLVDGADRWPTLRGLAAPTLFGTSEARLVRIPLFEVSGMQGVAAREGVDAAIMYSELAGVLSRAVGEPVHGLLGYSFLKHFRIAIDYVHRIAWFDPIPGGWEDRPYEYSHVGLQFGREHGEIRVLAVAEDSPAARAGIIPGDVVLAVDGEDVSHFDVVSLARHLEGPEGTQVRITLRRGDRKKSYRLARERLL